MTPTLPPPWPGSPGGEFRAPSGSGLGGGWRLEAVCRELESRPSKLGSQTQEPWRLGPPPALHSGGEFHCTGARAPLRVQPLLPRLASDSTDTPGHVCLYLSLDVYSRQQRELTHLPIGVPPGDKRPSTGTLGEELRSQPVSTPSTVASPPPWPGLPSPRPCLLGTESTSPCPSPPSLKHRTWVTGSGLAAPDCTDTVGFSVTMKKNRTGAPIPYGPALYQDGV